MIIPFSGGCACGAIRYSCSEAPVRMLNCHCRDCQKAGGSAYSATLIVAAHAIHLTAGAPRQFETIAESGNTAVRRFCGNCGTPLFASSSGRPAFTAIRAATLDDPAAYEPEADVWVGSAQPWDCMDSAIPKFSKNRNPRTPV